MSQELAIRKMHSDGFSQDDIAITLEIPLVVVEEALDLTVVNDTNGAEPPIIYDIKELATATKEEMYSKGAKFSNLIIDQTMLNINNPETLNNLGKASVILQNVLGSVDKLKEAKSDTNKFSKYLQD